MANNNRTITSANAVFILVVPGIYNTGLKIEGFATDNAFDVDAAEVAEAQMGVDGKLAAGLTPTPRIMNIHLQANSKSRDTFDNWMARQIQQGDVIQANAVITLPSVNKTYILTNGTLQMYPVIPGAKKVLQPTDYKIVWESIVPQSI
jgi:hypothetical protein